MSPINLTCWILGGALVASSGLNLYQASQRAQPVPIKAELKTLDLLQKINLTSKQREEILNCCNNCPHASRDVLAADIEIKTRALDQALQEDVLVRTKIHALAKELGALRGQHFQSVVHAVEQVRNSLSPEQLDMLRKLGQAN